MSIEISLPANNRKGGRTMERAGWAASAPSTSKSHRSTLPQGSNDEMAIVRHNWLGLPAIELDARHLEENRIVSISPADERQAFIDMLRTRVLTMMSARGWRTLAITSPTPGCGKSTLAVDLALSVAKQSDFRTALVDLNLRQPAIRQLLGLKQTPQIEKWLRGQTLIEESLVRHGNTLAIASNSKPVSHASELLRDQATGKTIADLRARLKLDLVIFDLPAMLPSDDVLAFLPSVDCVLLVGAAEQSSLNEIDICERDLAEQDKLLGVVLTKCHYTPDKYGY
jgi:protein-tyrosine kinase